MISSIVLRISRTLICSKRLYGLLRHGKNQLEEGCVVRRQFVKVIDFLEGERSRFPGKRTAGNDGEGRMGNDHLSRRSSPTASTSFHPAGLGKSMGHETHTKNHENNMARNLNIYAPYLQALPWGIGWRIMLNFRVIS